MQRSQFKMAATKNKEVGSPEAETGNNNYEQENEDVDTDTADGKKRVKGSILHIIKTLSVEPAGFLLIMSVIISHLIFQNLLMETICRVDLGKDEALCKEIINKVNISNKADEREIQKVAAGISAITSVLFSSLTICIVLFIGPWSDVNGRKIPIVLSFVGLIAFTGMMILCYLLMGKISAISLSLLAMLPMAATGGPVVFSMSAYSYISDTTSAKNRTVRTGILSASVRSGTPFGFAIGGTLTRVGVGTVPSLLVALSLALLGFFIVLLRVQNIKNPGKPEDKDGAVIDKKAKKSACIRYNPLRRIAQAFTILFKKRENYTMFLLLIVCHVCYAAPGHGEMSMLYLFVREKLQWNVSDYGYFSMYNWLMSAAGVVLSMFILSKKLKISDAVVGFVAGISQIGGSMTYAFTYSAIMMYCASAFDMMNGTIGVVVRSMLSKIVAQNEVGKLFALLGVIESLLPLIMVPSYAMLYRSTVAVFPGSIFVLSAVVTIPAEIIFLYFICKKDNQSRPVNDAKAADELESLPVEDGIKDGAAFDQKNERVPEFVQLMQAE